MSKAKLFLGTILLLNTIIGLSQRNRKPCNITGGSNLTVEPNGTCDGSTWDLADMNGTAYGTNATHDFGTPSCAVNGAADGWFSFTAPASGLVDITTQAGTINALAMEVYTDNCPSAGTSIGCLDGNGAMLNVSLTSLTAGNRYFIRVWSENGVNENGSFNICIEDGAGGCTDTYGSLSAAICSAPNATVGGACVNGDNTNVSFCAMGGCLDEGSQDFIRFTATGTDHSITMNSTGIQDANVGIIDLTTACPTPAVNGIIQCNTTTGGGSTTITRTDFTIGEEYYIFVESDPADQGTFEICVTAPVVIPGCTDPTADHNYNPAATVDDGSCESCSDGIINGDETGIDCGGATCPACVGGSTVLIGSMGTYSGCDANFYDTGDASGDYSSSETVGKIICNSVASECVSLYFNSFDIESGWDFLRLYDGTSNSDPLIGTYDGNDLEGVTIGSITGNCVYAEFTSDGSVQYSGWDAYISCGPCPTCSDGIQNQGETGVDCGGPCAATCPGETCADPIVISALPYSATNSTTCGFGDDYDATDACLSGYMDGDDIVYEYVSAGNECVTMSLTNTSTSWGGLFLMDGCPSGMSTSCLASSTSFNSTPSINHTITSAGTYYFIVSTDPTPQCIDYDIDITSSSPGGAGRDCSTPHSITDNFSQDGLTTNCFGNDYSSSDACASSYMNGSDYVFEYTVTSTSCVDVSLTNVSAGTSTGLFLLDGCPDGGGTSCVASSTASSTPNIGATVTAGTYYIVVSTDNSPFSTDFDIDVVATPTSGGATCGTPYNIASIPFSLTGQNTACYGDDYSSSDACSSTYMNGDDFVFTYTPPSNDCVTIGLTGTAEFSTGLFLLDNCPSAGGATCVASSTGTDPQLQGVNITGGTTYYIVVSTDAFPQSTPFDFNIYSNGGAPANDLCTGAIPLTIGTSADGDLACSGSAGEPAAPACWTSGTLNTVWYSVVAPASGELVISTGLDDPTPDNDQGTQIEVFSSMGGCGSLTNIGCNNDPSCKASSDLSTSTLTLSGLTSGNTYYIRVDGELNSAGDFTITAYDPATPSSFPAGAECVSSQPVCSQSFNVGDPGFQGIGAYCDFPNSPNNCLLSGERGSAWYTLEIANDGILQFAINPNDANYVSGSCDDGFDYDYAVWRLSGMGTTTTCADILSSSGDLAIACDYSGTGTTGITDDGDTPDDIPCSYDDAFDNNGGSDGYPINVYTGDIYLINVSNFSNSESGFTLDLSYMADIIDTTTNPICGNTVTSIKMAKFEGKKVENSNLLKWSTVVESEHDRFELERSFDGRNFKVIADIKSLNGTSYAVSDYQYIDKDIAQTAYYRLNSISQKGYSDYSKTVVINGDVVIPSIYPNPAKDMLNVDYNSKGDVTVQIFTITGNTVIQKMYSEQSGLNSRNISLAGISKGTYLVKVETNEHTHVERLVIE